MLLAAIARAVRHSIHLILGGGFPRQMGLVCAQLYAAGVGSFRLGEWSRSMRQLTNYGVSVIGFSAVAPPNSAAPVTLPKGPENALFRF